MKAQETEKTKEQEGAREQGREKRQEQESA